MVIVVNSFNNYVYERRREVLELVKSVIISEKGGIPIQQLRDTYRYLVGEDIPVQEIGYNSLYQLIGDIPQVRPSRNENNDPVLVASSPRTEHLEYLIRKQKPSSESRSGRNINNRRKRHLNDDAGYYSTSKSKCFKNSEKKLPLYNDISFYTVSSKLQEKKEVPVIKIANSKPTRMYEPLIKDKQLIGDDFFLQLCIRYLDFPFERRSNKSAIRCGTVASGQTLKSFLSTIKTINNMSNKIMICLGTEDIYQRRSFEDMKDDIEDIIDILSEKFGYGPKQITFCTLPPLANVTLADNRLRTFYKLNTFIKNDLKEKCEVIDLYSYYTVDNTLSVDFDLFQENARMVSGTINPYVLWNLKGRQLAMKIFTSTYHTSF